MAIKLDQAREELYWRLVRVSDGEFACVRDAFDRDMVGFVYGRQMGEMLTDEFLHAVIYHRNTKAASLAVGRSDNMYRPGYNYNYNEDYRTSPTIQAQLVQARRENNELLDKNTRLEQELSDLRRRFESLFRVPAVGMRTEIDQPPDNPEQWRVRIHVPAFTVETTMGALTAARVEPRIAMSWGQHAAIASDAMAAALEQASIHISTHIITGNHPIESTESETPQAPT